MLDITIKMTQLVFNELFKSNVIVKKRAKISLIVNKIYFNAKLFSNP